ncbi:MAG: hypothetical protein AAFV19_23040 [Pseudomonadota bacterium]
MDQDRRDQDATARGDGSRFVEKNQTATAETAGAALREITNELARIDRNIAKVSDPVAKTFLQTARSDLAGALADLTGDRETSARYGQGARQIPVGAQDLRAHGAMVRARFENAAQHLRDKAGRIGLALEDVSARLSLGRPVTAGQVRDWEASDYASVLGKAGKTLETATPADLDAAKIRIDAVTQKVLATYDAVVLSVRQEIRRALDREASAIPSISPRERGRAGRTATQCRDDGISL